MCFYPYSLTPTPRPNMEFVTDLPPILFLHGLATTSQRTWGENGWFDLVNEAGRDYLPIDLPGHGTEYSPSEDFNGDLVNYVNLHIAPPVVDGIGFSLGAQILLKTALLKPERFRKIVLSGVGDSLFEPDQARGLKISNAISGKGSVEDPETLYFSRLAEHADINGSYIAKYLSGHHTPILPRDLTSLDIPVLVVLGENDFAGPATTLMKSLPEADLVTLKGVDHFATPKDFHFLEAALDFLDAEPNW